MKRVGLGGLTMFDVSQSGIPVGPHKYMEASWQEMFAFEIAEAKRLGLEVMAHNGPGYSGNGGPWIPPERAAQTVVSSALRIVGGQPFNGPLPKPAAKGGWYRDIAVLAIQETEAQSKPPTIDGNAGMKRLQWLGYVGWRAGASAPLDATAAANNCIPRRNILDVTSHLTADGTLAWDAPSGDWTLLRLGHTWTGQKTLPATPEGLGPECDKLDPRGIRLHFNHVLKRLIELGGSASGSNFHSFFADSWEAGGQNWTEKMPEEFRRRRGYDAIPFLPVLTGRVLDDQQTSERFLYDLRQTVSELATENFWAELRRLCNAQGMRFAAQPYITTGNDLDAANHLDEPMGEFWMPGCQALDYRRTVKLASSVANLNGKVRVGVEAFTANESERWRSHPAILKPLADQIFCLGANRFQIHRFAMQRFSQLRPGMMMGPWDLQYDSTQTWWEWTKPWHDYLARCQFLLSQGPVVTDVLAVVPEEPLWRFNPLTLSGYDYDACGPDRFRDIVMCADGNPGLPGGPTYRLIQVNHDGRMTLARLQQLRDLLNQGATILCEPPKATPGLDFTGHADRDLQTLVNEVWGMTGEADRRLGKGRLLRGMPLAKALTTLGVAPDTIVPPGVKWIHRRKGDLDWWFMTHSGNEAVTIPCSLRIVNANAERWDPETGAMTTLDATISAGRTVINLPFAPEGSAFIVFRPVTGTQAKLTASSQPPVSASSVELSGPWTIQFPPISGVQGEVCLDRLVSWSDHPDLAVRAFSGTAVYRSSFKVPTLQGPLILDLGRVEVMARVRVNGVDHGILWKPPYSMILDKALRDGSNEIEIEVVNLWINRLISDAALPDDSPRAKNGHLQKWPDWVLTGGSSPIGRQTFVTIPQWKPKEALVLSGLLGPVTVKPSIPQPSK